MKTPLVVAACFLTSVWSVADDKKDPMAGKWVVEAVTRYGKVDDSLKGATRVHEDGKYTSTLPAAGPRPGPIRSTPAGRPRPST